MKVVKKLLGFAEDAGEVDQILVSEPPEIQKEQWSALYVTNIETDLAGLDALLSSKLQFTQNQIFEKVLAPGNKISVLNALNPGVFGSDEVLGVVLLINATSFSEFANILLKELYDLVVILVKHHPGAYIGELPNQNFSSEQLEAWLKSQRDKYFFID